MKTIIKNYFDKYLIIIENFISKILALNDIKITTKDLESYYKENIKYGRIKAFFIPTRVFSEIVKKKDIKKFPEYMSFLVKRSLYGTLLIIVVLFFLEQIVSFIMDENFINLFYFFTSSKYLFISILTYFTIFVIMLWSTSRILEIFLAFYKDAYTHLKKNENRIIPYSQRVKLALYSYLELIFLFGVLYYCLSAIHFVDMFKEHLRIIDAIYFSGVTITTLGYGDIVPTNFLTKFLVIFEVICGFTLVIVSFTIYVSRAINDLEESSE